MTKIGTISGQKNKNMENYYASFLKNKKSKKNKGNLADKNGEKNMGKNMDNNVGNVGSVSNQMGVMKVNFDSILKGDVCKESEVDNSFRL